MTVLTNERHISFIHTPRMRQFTYAGRQDAFCCRNCGKTASCLPRQSFRPQLSSRHPKARQRRVPSHAESSARKAHVPQKPPLSRQKSQRPERAAARPSNAKPRLRRKQRRSRPSKPSSTRRQSEPEKRQEGDSDAHSVEEIE